MQATGTIMPPPASQSQMPFPGRYFLDQVMPIRLFLLSFLPLQSGVLCKTTAAQLQEYRPRLSPIHTYQHNISPCLNTTKHILVTISTLTESERDRSLDLKRNLATSEVSDPERHPFAPTWYSRPLPHNATSKQREKSQASYE